MHKVPRFTPKDKTVQIGKILIRAKMASLDRSSMRSATNVPGFRIFQRFKLRIIGRQNGAPCTVAWCRCTTPVLFCGHRRSPPLLWEENDGGHVEWKRRRISVASDCGSMGVSTNCRACAVTTQHSRAQSYPVIKHVNIGLAFKLDTHLPIYEFLFG